MDLVDALIDSEALRIAPPGELFFYTSATVGPYYINTHFLYGGPETAQELLDFIDASAREPSFGREITDRVMARMEGDSRYEAVIDLLAEAVVEGEQGTAADWVSGGERRDWFFSVGVAARLQRPHLFLYKNGDAAREGEDGRLDAVTDLAGATTVHVADLVTEASSYERAWIPAIRERGGQMLQAVNVVDRAQGGMDLIRDAGVAARALMRVDGELFDALKAKGIVDGEQFDTLVAYLADPQAAMAAFLTKNPGFLQAALAADDEKTVARARQLVEQDPYDLGLSR